MINNQSVMMKNRFILFLLILPAMVLSKSDRRRRPLDYQLDNDKPYDQLAQASQNRWPDRVASTSHTVFKDSDDISHSNFVVTLMPKRQRGVRQLDDFVISDELAETESAEEYVSKAMHMHSKFGDRRPPVSSFTKYDVVDHPVLAPVKIDQRSPHSEQKSQSFFPIHHEREIEPKRYQQKGVKHHVIQIIETATPTPITQIDKSEILSHIEESVIKYFKELQEKKTKEESPIRTYIKFKPATPTNSYKEQYHISSTRAPFSTSKPSFKVPVTKQTLNIVHSQGKLSDHQHPAQEQLQQQVRSKHIDHSVTDAGHSWSQHASFDHSAVLKTVQGFGATNAIDGQNKQKKLHFTQQTYHDINALPYTSEKGGEEETSYYKGFSYPEVSSYSKVQDGGSASVGASISVGHKEPEYNVKVLPPPEYNVKVLPPPEYNVKILPPTDEAARGPLHIINGIPVSNPYKMDLEAIRYMLGGLAQVQSYDSKKQEKEEDYKPQSSNWHPYPMTSDPESTGPNVYPTSSLSSGVKKGNIVYDSYSPKFNNNPKGEGYQDIYKTKNKKKTNGGSFTYSDSYKNYKKEDGLIKNDGFTYNWAKNKDNVSSANTSEWEPTNDLYSSSSNTNTKTAKLPNWTRTTKSPNTTRNRSKKTRNLDTELKPPPRYIKY